MPRRSHDATGEVESYAPYGVFQAVGTDVPPDGMLGYSRGCIFHKLTGGSGDYVYINTGDSAGAAFEQIDLMAGGSGGSLHVQEVINVKQAPYNALGNGVADDTAAIQAAIDAAEVSGLEVFFPPGTYRVTGLTINDTTTAKFVSLRGCGGDLTIIDYIGSGSGVCLTISRSSYWEISGIVFRNATGSRATTTGIFMTGPETVGTQVIAGTFRRVRCISFHIGIQAGGMVAGKAASEILYEHVGLYDNDIGWTDLDFNTLDHIFHMLLLGENDIGVKVNACNIAVHGGSASNSETADFELQGNTTFSIRNFRSEHAGLFVEVISGNVLLDSCWVNPDAAEESPVDQVLMSNTGDLSMINCMLNGMVHVAGTSRSLRMRDNWVVGNDSTGLPFFIDSTAGYTLRYDVANNSAWWALQGGTPDYRWYDDEAGIYLSERRVKFSATRGLADFQKGHSANYLYRICGLSSGSVVEGKTLRGQVTFATSDTATLDFARDVTGAINSGSRTITVAAGGLSMSDVGKKVFIAGAGFSGIDLITFCESVESATEMTVHAYPGTTNGSITVTLGEDEPDTKYFVAVGCSAQETISVAKATTGITLTSSNSSSTATVDVIIVR